MLGENIALRESNFSMHNPNIGSTSLRGQDRSVTSQYARETDKDFPLDLFKGRIYSPNFDYK